MQGHMRLCLLVYSGGVSGSLYNWVQCLFGSSYDVKEVTESILLHQPWEAGAAALIFGGDSSSLKSMCDLPSEVKSRIRKYVDSGGVYMGIGAGSSFGCGAISGEGDSSMLLNLLKLKSVAVANENTEVELIVKSHIDGGPENISGRINTKIKSGDTGFLLIASTQNSPACESAKCVHACYCMSNMSAKDRNNEIFSKDSVPAIIIYKLGSGICFLCGIQIDKIYDSLVNDDEKKLYNSLVRNLFSCSNLFVSNDYDPNYGDRPSELVCMYAVHSGTAEWLEEYLNGFGSSEVGGEDIPFDHYKHIEYKKLSPHPLYSPLYAAKISPSVETSGIVPPLNYFCKKDNLYPVLYFPSIGSTQTFLEDDTRLLKLIPDFLPVVASIQTKGRGRSTNKWSTPSGSIAFSFAFSYPELDNKYHIIQNIAAVSIVSSLSVHCDLVDGAKVCLKWPNDICVSQNGVFKKVGGIIISRKEVYGVTKYIVGCGLNFTRSVKSLTYISDYMKDKDASIDVAEFLKNFFSSLESIIHAATSGAMDFVKFCYTSNWIHTNAPVLIHPSAIAEVLYCSPKSSIPNSPRSGETVMAKVAGIDDFGFLLAEDKLGNKYALEPDGNSFDLSKNMICRKL